MHIFCLLLLSDVLQSVKEGRLETALRQAEQTVRERPASANAFTVLGAVQTKLRLYSQAVSSMKRAVELEPTAESWVNLGVALAQLSHDKLPEAVDAFTEAVRLDASFAPARYHRGRALFNLSLQDEAHAELKIAHDLDPSQPSYAYLLAFIEDAKGASARAAELLEKVVQLDPNNAPAHYLLGRSRERQGRLAEAVISWRRTVQLDPTHSAALYKLSRALKTSDPDASSRYLKMFRELKQSPQI